MLQTCQRPQHLVKGDFAEEPRLQYFVEGVFEPMLQTLHRLYHMRKGGVANVAASTQGDLDQCCTHDSVHGTCGKAASLK